MWNGSAAIEIVDLDDLIQAETDELVRIRWVEFRGHRVLFYAEDDLNRILVAGVQVPYRRFSRSVHVDYKPWVSRYGGDRTRGRIGSSVVRICVDRANRPSGFEIDESELVLASHGDLGCVLHHTSCLHFSREARSVHFGELFVLRDVGDFNPFEMLTGDGDHDPVSIDGILNHVGFELVPNPGLLPGISIEDPNVRVVGDGDETFRLRRIINRIELPQHIKTFARALERRSFPLGDPFDLGPREFES